MRSLNFIGRRSFELVAASSIRGGVSWVALPLLPLFCSVAIRWCSVEFRLPFCFLERFCTSLHCSFCVWSMNAGGSFGGNRGLRPVPPEKGVFPLDHMHLCDLEKKEYLNCLKFSSHQSEKCRLFSKKYLECRMEKNLMAKQDMSELGFGRGDDGGVSRKKMDERIDN